jgi:PAS domain S-box-containing protein
MLAVGDSKRADKQAKSSAHFLGALPALIFIGLVIICRAYLPSTGVFEPPYLLPIANTLFLACVPFGIAYFAGRIYLATGSLNILLIGCALLVFGTGNLVAGWAIDFAAPNSTVTIHNIASAAASILYVMAALALANRSIERIVRRRKANLFSFYVCTLIFVAILSAATILNVTPVFFVAGRGPTLLREVVLSVAVILHTLAALFALRLYRQRKAAFIYWLSLALLLTATGLAAVAMQMAVGSLIGWVGRVAQYLGAVYFLVATIVMIREARLSGTTVEQALASFFRESELRYKNLVETAKVGIVSTDGQGQIMLWNPAAEAMFGFTQNEAVGSRLTDLVGFDGSLMRWFDEEESIPLGTKALAATLRRRDGSPLYSDVSVAVAEVEEGRIVTFVIRDITERTLMEEALAEERDFVSAVLDTAGAFVIVLDREGRITRFNRACQEITGYSATEVLGREFWEFLIPPEEMAGVKATWERLKAGDFPNRYENHWVAKDGSRRLIAWSNTVLTGGKGEVEYIIGTGIDITAQRQAEQFLQESEDRFRAIASSTPDHVLVQDRDLRYTLVINPQLGLTAQQMIGKTDQEILSREDADRLTEIKKQVLRTGRSVRLELPLIPPEGEPQLFDGSYIPKMNARGAVDGLIGYFKNVTERKEREMRIARLSKLYAMLSRVNEAIVRTRDEMTLYDDVCRTVAEEGAFSLVWIGQVREKEVVPVASCGPATDYLKEIRVSVEGVLGAGPTGTCIREDRPVINDDFDTNPSCAPWREPALRHGFRASAAFPLHRQGRVVGALTLYASERGSFEAEQVKLLEALAADLSYALDTFTHEQLRARAETGLQRSLRRFELLAQTSGALLQAAEPQKIVNALCREIMEYLDCHAFFNFLVIEGLGKLRLNAYTGIPEDEARKIEWLDFGVAVCGCDARDATRIVAEHIPTTPDVRTELVKSYGIRAYACHPMLSPGEKVIGTLSFGTRSRDTFSEEDLSLMKAVTDLVAVAVVRDADQQSLRKARDELEERVKERTLELQQAYEAVKNETEERKRVERQLRQVQKMEAMGTLAGGIAHDLNNILMPIMLNTEMALLDITQTSPVSRYLQLVLEAANRGRELIKQIVTFSRQKEEAKTPLEVGPVIEEALRFLRASIPMSIEIRSRIDTIPGLILGDVTQIQQVVMNLCSNAAHAMRGMGGVLDLTLEAIEIHEGEIGEQSSLKPGSYVELRIQDTGPGMSTETLERVFDPFFTTKRPGEGTGLGLAVVHGIVKAHGGTIVAQSEEGKGSTFTVFLPLVKGSLIKEGTLPRPISRGNERILLVDDEEIQIQSLKPGLEKLGYRVIGKTDPLQALELFRAQPDAFDLVITDQTMPHMVGYDLAKELFRIRPDVPVILCTGFSEAVHEAQARAAGICEFVMKPFSAGEIAERIRRALGKIS